MNRPSGTGYTGIPSWIYAIAAVGAVLVLLPLVAMVAKVNWPQFIPLVTSEASLTALGLSLRTSGASTILCILLGVPLALVLARTPFPGQRLLRAFVLLPLVLPPVVGGIALLYTFGRQGLLGRSLELVGIQIAFSTGAGHVLYREGAALRALAALVAYSRVHTGVHFPGDVVVGSLHGSVCAQAAVHTIDRRRAG